MKAPLSAKHSWHALLAGAAFAAALIAAAAVALAICGARFGWWNYLTGFQVFTVAALSAITAIMLSLVSFITALCEGRRRGIALAVNGATAGVLLLGVPAYLLSDVSKLPPIHDVTTDTDNPPRFINVLALRRDAPNAADYGGPALASQQKLGYPDLAPLKVGATAESTFKLALQTAREMRWEIAAATATEYRIEATATTPWFGFKDDIVIRISPSGADSRVDMRSVSRVGLSDLGANAKRIREFLRRLRTATPAQ